MIIIVSIVDKHKPEGQLHVGTYMFEIDYPESHFDFCTVAGTPEGDRILRPYLNRLLSLEDISQMEGGAVNGNGNPVDENGKER